MSRAPLRVAVLGAGTVGRAVVCALLERADELRPADGPALVLSGIAVRDVARAIERGLPAELLTDAPAHLVADDEADVIVELMGGDEPAHTLISAALSMGKSVVTANKHVIAHHGPELEAAARRNGAALRFEASVGGGIPVLGPIASDLAANRIDRVRGIVNGTTNYILSAMTDEDAATDYATALAEAQRLGYAEADPSGDVEGHDAVNKLVILARLAFDRWLDPATIPTTPAHTGGPAGPGITTVSLADQRDARARAGSSGSWPVRHATPTTRWSRRSCRPHCRSIRRSAARPASATGSRSMANRSAVSRSTVRAPAVPRPRPRCSATSSRWPAVPVPRGARGGRRADPRRPRRRPVRGRSSKRGAGSGTPSMTDLRGRRASAAHGALPAVLPVTDATPALTLGEGGTPLVHARRLGAAMGLANLHLKVEGQNPTGSFKDRGMVVAVAKAAEAGATAIVCASTGNTSASAAAYGAAAGMEVIVVLPKGHIAMGKLLQALAAGARVIAIDGNFDQALAIVRSLAEQDDHPVTLVNSVNPFRLDGQKTGAFEVCDQLGRAPDVLAIPVGNAGNISAYWAGFREYAAAGEIDATPRMWGFQAAGAAPLVSGRRVDHPETVATAIRIGDPASWALAIAARDASGGRIAAVTDEEILSAYRDLARVEGIFCEPASAAGVAGVRQAAAAGELDPDMLIVCVLTGHGLKDPKTAEREVPAIIETDATVGSVAVALGW